MGIPLMKSFPWRRCRITREILFCMVFWRDTDSAFVEDSQLWNSLDAVKEGRVLSYEQVAFMHRDPITLNAQLDIFLEFFRSFKEEA